MKRAILLVDHGSKRAEANDMLASVADLVREEVDPGEIVEIAHMELARPTIEEGFAACVAAGAEHVSVHPYMLAPGRHATGDIPKLAAAAAGQHPGVTYSVTEPLGLHPNLAKVVVERVRAALERAPSSNGEP